LKADNNAPPTLYTIMFNDKLLAHKHPLHDIYYLYADLHLEKTALDTEAIAKIKRLLHSCGSQGMERPQYYGPSRSGFERKPVSIWDGGSNDRSKLHARLLGTIRD